MSNLEFNKSSSNIFPVLDKDLDLNEMEARIRALWEKERVYSYDESSPKKIFSVDTPPPYVSAAHLHVGHAMSYTQAEIVVRYKRMQGYNIFYPMGFDDNGLPTERYVEKNYNIDKSTISRSDFRALCIQETQKGAQEYEKLWRALGLSVDWDLRYSTIDERSTHTAQKSFLDLYKKGLIHRANEPVLWDTQFETSLAQADVETIPRRGKMYDIGFSSQAGAPLIISTTRPELIPACVALFVNPEDERYKDIVGKRAKVPLFDYDVPILSSPDVAPDFGTGLMMVSTFGDNEDVKKWKDHDLETRMIIGKGGRMNDLAGPYAGLKVQEARKRILEDLSAAGKILKECDIEQSISIGERSETPVEFVMTPQWFINLLDNKDRLRNRASTINWFPEFMKVRLDQWIDGLKYDWNISRQRFYGVPFPLWYVKETGDVIIGDENSLPIDPTADAPPAWALEKYKGMTIVPETDVMDTWMTSSLSPLINANWAGRNDIKGTMDQIYPMDLRIQGFEIIRTWLFYTMVKSDFHTDALPWKDVMISGWGLNEQGKKISKRDLEKYTDAEGYNRYDPYALINKYGADGLRYWAASSQLGNDLRFQERDVKDGRKIVVKLWNVARMSFMNLEGFQPARDHIPFKQRPLEDQWILSELNRVIEEMTESFEKYNYAAAKDTLGKFFWKDYCDDYLEIVKGRFTNNFGWTKEDRFSAQCTIHESLRTLLGAFAPFLPYVTEEIYQKAAHFGEKNASLHATSWPKPDHSLHFDHQPEMEALREFLREVRRQRSNLKLGAGALLEKVAVGIDQNISGIPSPSLKSAARCMSIEVTGENSMVLVPYAEGEARHMEYAPL